MSGIALDCAMLTRCVMICFSSVSWTPSETKCPISISIFARLIAGRLIDYVRKKYGHVAQIITFGTMKARAVVRDVSRVLGVPLSEADKVAKLIPLISGITLDKALETEPELKALTMKINQSGK